MSGHNQVTPPGRDAIFCVFNLERETESFRIGLLLKKARESRHMTQEELGQLIDKKRTYISLLKIMVAILR
jgi:hypothetical protein